MSDMSGVGPVVDLGAINRRNQEREKVPPYAVGTPELVLQVAVNTGGTISFRAAIERGAFILGADGFKIDEVKQCAFAGADQAGNVVFQLVVVASETEEVEADGR
jgi:hypothetical protein